MRMIAAAALLLILSWFARAQAVPAAAPPSCLPVSAGLDRARRYDAIILRHSQKRRLNPRLVKAIIAVESQFTAEAVSPSGARGLMQVMPATSREMGVPDEDLSDPESNVRAGTEYLSRLFTAARRGGGGNAGTVRRVVAAYHSGPGALDAGIWSASTRRYVRTVMSCYRSEASVLEIRPADDARVVLTAWNAEMER